jgi:hypothetical protein
MTQQPLSLYCEIKNNVNRNAILIYVKLFNNPQYPQRHKTKTKIENITHKTKIYVQNLSLSLSLSLSMYLTIFRGSEMTQQDRRFHGFTFEKKVFYTLRER